DFASVTQRSAVWIDTKDAYWTLDNEYIESVWWLVKRLWDGGLIYEGHRVTPYCARCGTALSSHEVAQGYEDVTDPSIYVRFPLLDDDADLLVWTTTPWTLISNVTVAAGPDITYVRVPDDDGGRDLVMARPLREGRRSRHHRRSRGPSPARARAAVSPQLPALLALRHAAHLLGQDVVVRAHVGPQGRAPGRERQDRLAPGAHPHRALR